MSAIVDRTGETFVPGNEDWMAHPDPERAARGDGHPDFTSRVPFLRFDPASGAILETGRMARAHIMRERMQTGGTIVGSGAPASHFVDLASRAVLPKTACPARLDGLVLRDLPVPCRIEIDNPGAAPSFYAWSESSLALAFDHPGTWTVRVLSVPHLPATFTVTADG